MQPAARFIRVRVCPWRPSQENSRPTALSRILGERMTEESSTNDRMDLGFETPVPQNGYRWWYVDGLSDCGRYGIVVIAFIGSVFSPYYFRARARGRGDPYQHCAINVALYGPAAGRWAMTERGANDLSIGADRFFVGPSGLQQDKLKLSIAVDERSAPLARRLRGGAVLETPFAATKHYELDTARQHLWQPIAPCARIRVAFDVPHLSWAGHAYLDTNWGERPLEADFLGWEWSRLRARGHTQIAYDAVQRSGEERTLSFKYADDGACSTVALPSATPLGGTLWRVARKARCPGQTRVGTTLEDTPFYNRTQLIVGDGQLAVHEALSLERFSQPWVRMLLPFRMPRVAR